MSETDATANQIECQLAAPNGTDDQKRAAEKRAEAFSAANGTQARTVAPEEPKPRPARTTRKR